MFNHTGQSADKADVCQILPTESRIEEFLGLDATPPPEIGLLTTDEPVA